MPVTFKFRVSTFTIDFPQWVPGCVIWAMNTATVEISFLNCPISTTARFRQLTKPGAIGRNAHRNKLHPARALRHRRHVHLHPPRQQTDDLQRRRSRRQGPDIHSRVYRRTAAFGKAAQLDWRRRRTRAAQAVGKDAAGGQGEQGRDGSWKRRHFVEGCRVWPETASGRRVEPLGQEGLGER